MSAALRSTSKLPILIVHYDCPIIPRRADSEFLQQMLEQLLF
ncbi:hypothetical protein CEV32_1379 [Brucella rhizosphaerae]|uniref:Uncharacterized protein n=1 Tax=Brucella rhizosphaerae TaxID=571254 RepID=A0A256FA88_9HYPH|nr:hypothetical protein CEV32_1379 [Brucella rhizosphaerae]